MRNPLKVSLDNIIPLTEARDHFSQIVNEVQKDKLYVLTKGGKPAVALVDVKYLEYITGGSAKVSEVETEILKDPEKVGRPPMIKHDENNRPSNPAPAPTPKPFTPTPAPAPKPFTPTPTPAPKPFTPTPSPTSKPFTPDPKPFTPAPSAKPWENKPADNQPKNDKPWENKSADNQPNNDKPWENKPSTPAGQSPLGGATPPTPKPYSPTPTPTPTPSTPTPSPAPSTPPTPANSVPSTPGAPSPAPTTPTPITPNPTPTPAPNPAPPTPPTPATTPKAENPWDKKPDEQAVIETSFGNSNLNRNDNTPHETLKTPAAAATAEPETKIDTKPSGDSYSPPSSFGASNKSNATGEPEDMGID